MTSRLRVAALLMVSVPLAGFCGDPSSDELNRSRATIPQSVSVLDPSADELNKSKERAQVSPQTAPGSNEPSPRKGSRDPERGQPSARAASGVTPGQSPAPSERLSQRSDRAYTRASATAAAFKRELREVQDVPSAQPKGTGAGAAAAASSLNPAAPSTVQDLALAELSGFSRPFSVLKLRIVRTESGAPSVRHLDGSPASEEELSQLKKMISSEPKVLLQRQDFFEVLPRRKYEALKRAIKEDKPGSPDLKDLGLSSHNRDIIWARSCSPVSGGCNPSAGGPYKRDEEASPEDLGRVWKKTKPEYNDDSFSEEDQAFVEERRRKTALLAPGTLKLGAMANLLDRLQSVFGGGGSAWGGSGEPQSSGVYAKSGGSANGRGSTQAGLHSSSGTAGLKINEPPLESGAIPPRKRGGIAFLILTAVAVLVVIFRRRRRRGSSGRRAGAGT